MNKLIGYARVSTRQQTTDRQESDLLAAGVRRDDLYLDRGVSGARASRPSFDKALDAEAERQQRRLEHVEHRPPRGGDAVAGEQRLGEIDDIQ